MHWLFVIVLIVLGHLGWALLFAFMFILME